MSKHGLDEASEAQIFCSMGRPGVALPQSPAATLWFKDERVRTRNPDAWRCCRQAKLVARSDSILVAWYCSGATIDYVLTESRKGAVTAVLKSLLPADAVVCTDGGRYNGQAVKALGLDHHPVVTSRGVHAIGAWHIQNVNWCQGASRAGCAAFTLSP
jgi:hypothetical protein